jgi:ribosomal protein S18 acetylase RimI-like enzyme
MNEQASPQIISLADWSEVSSLSKLAKCFAEAFQRTDPEQIEAQIRRELEERQHYVVAVLDQTVYGFVSWRTWFEPRHRLAELVHIGVLPGHGIPGLARQLVAHMEEQVHEHYRQLGYTGVRKMFLLTHMDNLMARGFYKRRGYQAVADQQGMPVLLSEFTREGVDEIMMVKDWPEHRLTV